MGVELLTSIKAAYVPRNRNLGTPGSYSSEFRQNFCESVPVWVTTFLCDSCFSSETDRNTSHPPEKNAPCTKLG